VVLLFDGAELLLEHASTTPAVRKSPVPKRIAIRVSSIVPS
jgi:hypothetical protein